MSPPPGEPEALWFGGEGDVGEGVEHRNDAGIYKEGPRSQVRATCPIHHFRISSSLACSPGHSGPLHCRGVGKAGEDQLENGLEQGWGRVWPSCQRAVPWRAERREESEEVLGPQETNPGRLSAPGRGKPGCPSSKQPSRRGTGSPHCGGHGVSPGRGALLSLWKSGPCGLDSSQLRVGIGS